jgi:hypothetical protein
MAEMEEMNLSWLVWAKDKDTIIDLALKAQLQEVLGDVEKLLEKGWKLIERFE